MAAGFVVSLAWIVLVKTPEAGAIGIVQKLADGKDSLLANHPNWPVVDPLVIALPVSFLVAVVVSLLTKPPTEAHLRACFSDASERTDPQTSRQTAKRVPIQ